MSDLALNFDVWAPSVWFLASLLIGYVLLQAIEARRTPQAIGLSESLFRSMAAGFLVSLGIAFILAELGWFRLRWILGALALVFLLSLFWAWWRGASWRLPRPRWEDLFPLVLALVLAGLTFRPHAYILGIDDPGTYASIAGSIARQESLTFLDPDVAALDSHWAQQELFFPSPWASEAAPADGSQAQFRYLTGFDLDSSSPGRVAPSFLHLFPTWMALNYKLGEIDGMLQAMMWTGILGILAVYFAGRTLFNRRTALVGALFLAVNLAFTWSHRTPTPASLAQALLFVLLYGLVRHHSREDKGAEILAALSLGAFLHTQINALLVLGVVAAWLLWVFVQKGRRPGYWRTFLVLVGLQLLHFLVYVRTIAWVYVRSTIWALRGRGVPWVLIPLGAGVIAMAFGIRRGWFTRNVHWIRLVSIGMVVALFLWVYFVSLGLPDPGPGMDTALGGLNLARLGRYLTPWGLGLGLGGLLLFLWRGRLSQAALLLGPALAYILSYLCCGEWGAGLLDSAQYMVAALVPGLLLGVAYLLEWLWYILPNWWSRLVPILLGVYLLAATGIPSITLAKRIDYRGAIGAVRQLSREVEQQAIILFANPAEALAFGPPLRFFFDRQVFALQQENPDTAALRTLVEQWDEQGRPAYLVAPQETEALALYGFFLDRQAIFSLQFPRLERTTEQRPSQVETIAYNFTLYRLHPLPALSPGQEIMIDVGSDDHPYVARGFHAKETTPDGRTFRWTEGEAEIELPGRWFCAQGVPTLTLVLSQNYISPDNPSVLNVRIGETPLGQIVPPQGWQAVHLRIPETLGPQFCPQEVVLLRLSGPTWQPSSAGNSVDQRFLGVALDQVIVTLP